MSYHNTSSTTSTTTTTSTTAAARSITNAQGQTAPPGYHYMPDGSLMADSEHGGYENAKIIKSFNLNTSDIKATGEVRKISISGDNGATFSLEIKNGALYYNFNTKLFQATKAGLVNVSITGGQYQVGINFPSVSAGAQYDFYLIANKGTKHSQYNEVRLADGSVDINLTTGSNSNIIRKVIYQTLDITLTVGNFSPNGTITGTNTSATITTSRNGTTSEVPFSCSFTVSSTRTLSINKQPLPKDMMVFINATVGAAPLTIPGENIYPRPTATNKVVNGAVTSGVNVTMDDDFTGLWAVGDRVTGNAALDARTQATAVTVAAVNVGSNAKVFAMSEAIAIDDDETLSFIAQRNHRWPISSTSVDLSKITTGMKHPAGNFFDGLATVRDYVDVDIVDQGIKGIVAVEKIRIPSVDTAGIKPLITRDPTTKVLTTTVGAAANPISITFDKQALRTLGGSTAKIFSYGTEEINRLTGHDVSFSDLTATLTEVSTVTTAAVNSSTSVPVANRAGIMDAISSVSGIGIDPNAAPTVASGAGSVTGAGTIVLSTAQTLENGAALKFPGAGSVVTIAGKIKVNKAGNEDVTLRFDLEKFLTMH